MSESSASNSLTTRQVVASRPMHTFDLNEVPDIIPDEEVNQKIQEDEDEDFEFSFSNVLALMRKVVPSDAGIHEDFVKDAIEQVNGFANTLRRAGKNKYLIDNNDILKGDEFVWAIGKMGKPDLARCVSFFMYRLREVERYKRDVAAGNPFPIRPQRGNQSFDDSPLGGNSHFPITNQGHSASLPAPSRRGNSYFPLTHQSNMHSPFAAERGSISFPLTGSIPSPRPVQIPMQIPEQYGITGGSMYRHSAMSRSQQLPRMPLNQIQLPFQIHARVPPNRTLRYNPYVSSVHGYGQYRSRSLLSYPRAGTSGMEEYGDTGTGTGEDDTSDESLPLPFTFI